MTQVFEYNKDADSPRLHGEIYEAGLGTLLEGVQRKSDTLVRVLMDDSISPSEITTLNGVIAAHINSPLPLEPGSSGVVVHTINGVSGMVTLEQVDGTIELTPIQVNASEGCVQIKSNLPSASGALIEQQSKDIATVSGLSGGGVFGQGMTHVDTDSTFSTSSSSWQQALQMTTPSLDAGDYYLTWSYEGTVEDNDDFRDTHRVRLNDDETLSQHTMAEDDKEPWQQVSAWAIRTLTAGVHTMDIDIRRGSDKSTKIRRRRLAIWRVT